MIENIQLTALLFFVVSYVIIGVTDHEDPHWVNKLFVVIGFYGGGFTIIVTTLMRIWS